ncbi:hypothetical protein KZ498_20665 [Haloarcula sp. 1CSR25-25]|nr:hypothetical protein [Haloarcula sp. 1CSR25-25]
MQTRPIPLVALLALTTSRRVIAAGTPHGRLRHPRHLLGRAAGLLLVAVPGTVAPSLRVVRAGAELALDSLIPVTPL